MEGTARHELGHFIYDELVTNTDRTALTQLFKSDELTSFIQTTCRSGAQESVSEFFAELISYMALYGWSKEKPFMDIVHNAKIRTGDGIRSGAKPEVLEAEL